MALELLKRPKELSRTHKDARLVFAVYVRSTTICMPLRFLCNSYLDNANLAILIPPTCTRLLQTASNNIGNELLCHTREPLGNILKILCFDDAKQNF
jgi:hypothetical protein